VVRMNGVEGLLVWASSQSLVGRQTGVYCGAGIGLSFSIRSWRCLYWSRRGRHGPVVCCLDTCCVILRETLYESAHIGGYWLSTSSEAQVTMGHIRRFSGRQSALHYRRHRSALLLTMVTLSTFCLRVSCGVSIRWGSLTFKLAL
jgi:hypothetical protein